MDIFIYGLMNPANGECFYVGKTNNPRVRLKDHCVASGNSRRAEYIRKIKQCGGKPEMLILQTCSEDDWKEWERKWIKLMSSQRCELTNVSDGGEEGRFMTHSSLTRQRLRDKFLGRPIPMLQREQISKSLTGKKQSRETVEKRLATINRRREAKGLPPHNSFESYEAYRLAGRQQYNEYRRAKRREQGKLVIGSPEWRANLSAKAKAQFEALSDEEKIDFKSRNTGKLGPNKGRKFGPLPPELRARLSKIHKERIAAMTPEQRKNRADNSVGARWKKRQLHATYGQPEEVC